MFEWIQYSWRAALEILILATLIYHGLRFIRGTRGATVLAGLIILLIILTAFGRVLHLPVIEWVLRHFFEFIGLAFVILFQPELRRALAEVGTGSFFYTIANEKAVIDDLVRTLSSFSARKVGSLIAIERENSLRSTAEAGAFIDAKLSQELLDQLFFQNSPLHDGGVVIQNDRILAAACIFPLTQRSDLAKSMGTRHRAALGLSEETDAVVLVVSEETGRISMACQGQLEQGLTADDLRKKLTEFLVGTPRDPWFKRFRDVLVKFNPLNKPS